MSHAEQERIPTAGRNSPALATVLCADEAMLAASGELDLPRHDEIRAALAAAVAVDLTLDLSDVTFVDVSTISLLAHAAENRQAAGRRTTIVGCQPTVRRVFRLARAEHLLCP